MRFAGTEITDEDAPLARHHGKKDEHDDLPWLQEKGEWVDENGDYEPNNLVAATRERNTPERAMSPLQQEAEEDALLQTVSEFVSREL